jgi:hypothetical protein
LLEPAFGADEVRVAFDATSACKVGLCRAACPQ